MESMVHLSKKSVIHLLEGCTSLTHFLQIHAQVYRHGLQDNNYVLNKLVAFTALVNLPYAERIVARLERRTLFMYNVMIKALVNVGSCEKALHLFDELRVQGLWPDNYTYPFVCKALGRLRFIFYARKIHGFALKSGMFYDEYVCTSVLDMYGELGFLESLDKLFNEIPVKGLISWNVLISSFVKNKRFEQAVGVYKRMGAVTNILPDKATVVSTLSACTALRNIDLGRKIHRYVSTQLGITPIIRNALLDMYAKSQHLDIARGLFDSNQEKDVACWTSMVIAYVNTGDLDEARALFESSPVRDLVLWTAMINGYVQFNRINEALELFRLMQMDKVKPDKYTLVALLTGCAQLGALEQGKWIHDYLLANKIAIDTVVGTALVEMYAKCGCLDKSLQIFHQMNRKDTASWTSMIFALAMNGNATGALQLFSEMIETGISPDDITFIGVLSACSHGGLVEEGRKHFASMVKICQIEPKLEHYGCMIDLMGRAGLLDEAEKLIDSVPDKDNKIVIPLYGALLSACRNYENVDLGERIAKKLVAVESNDSCSRTLVANIYAAASRWEDVMKVRKKMVTLGTKKLPGCSSALEVEGDVTTT